jgi:hypothetical protein
MTDTTSIVVKIDPGDDANAQELEDHTVQLLSDLRRLDADVDRIPKREVPKLAKGMGAEAGLLLVKLGPGAIGALAGALQAWLGRGTTRKITVRIDGNDICFDHPTAEQREKLVEAFLAAAATGDA